MLMFLADCVLILISKVDDLSNMVSDSNFSTEEFQVP